MRGRVRLFRLLLPFAVYLLALSVWAAETSLPAALDLPQHALLAQSRGMPLILMVSLPDCPYCEQVRRQQLAPLYKQGVEIRQIYVNSGQNLIGFDGQVTTQRQVAAAYSVKATPTVLFLGPRGKVLAPPIVGALLEDFYSAYLDQAIADAKLQLAE